MAKTYFDKRDPILEPTNRIRDLRVQFSFLAKFDGNQKTIVYTVPLWATFYCTWKQNMTLLYFSNTLNIFCYFLIKDALKQHQKILALKGRMRQTSWQTQNF